MKVTPTSEVGFLAENDYYLANFDLRLTAAGVEDSGTLRALTYKPAGITLLRTPNRMHWAPSFQRAGARGYTSLAMWQPVQRHRRQVLDDVLVFQRSGTVAQYPEIEIDCTYRLFPDTPYIEFEATLDVVKPIDMYWLRGQEMTMDEYFTHVAWPEHLHTFEEAKPLLAESPLEKDVPWLAFWNPARRYGIGAVILDYQASTENGANTQIADGANNGKYWYRQIIAQRPTALKPGDRYYERTAFVLFQTLDEFQSWERKLRA